MTSLTELTNARMCRLYELMDNFELHDDNAVWACQEELKVCEDYLTHFDMDFFSFPTN